LLWVSLVHILTMTWSETPVGATIDTLWRQSLKSK
jgi:hypothetical protein